MSRHPWAIGFLAAALLLAAAALSFAVPTDVTYSEGDASIRFKNGKQQDAEIGAVINTGDMVKTGRDGLVELDQKGVVLKISPNTVFSLQERNQKGTTTPVLSVALGSIKFRYDKLTGREPAVQTNGAAMGVRGTEFSVYAGADGSTLVLVDSGSVEVEADGKAVSLSADEGVEVKLGKGPGEKFAVHRDQIDYSKWNEDKLAGMLADPDAAMTGIEERMASYITSVTEYDGLYKEYKKTLDAERQKALAISKEKGNEEARKYDAEFVTPLMLQTSNLFLNLRYHALAALSLRRWVGGRLYLFQKARYMTSPADPGYADFLARFHRLLDEFREGCRAAARRGRHLKRRSRMKARIIIGFIAIALVLTLGGCVFGPLTIEGRISKFISDLNTADRLNVLQELLADGNLGLWFHRQRVLLGNALSHSVRHGPGLYGQHHGCDELPRRASDDLRWSLDVLRAQILQVRDGERGVGVRWRELADRGALDRRRRRWLGLAHTVAFRTATRPGTWPSRRGTRGRRLSSSTTSGCAVLVDGDDLKRCTRRSRTGDGPLPPAEPFDPAVDKHAELSSEYTREHPKEGRPQTDPLHEGTCRESPR